MNNDDRLDRYLNELTNTLDQTPAPARTPFDQLATRAHTRQRRRQHTRNLAMASAMAITFLAGAALLASRTTGREVQIVTDTTKPATSVDQQLSPGPTPAGYVVTSEQTGPSGVLDEHGQPLEQRDIEYDGPGETRIVITIIADHHEDLDVLNQNNEGRFDKVRGVRASIVERDGRASISWNDPSGDYVQILGINSTLRIVRSFAEQLISTSR
jgi:hypothetical protein